MRQLVCHGPERGQLQAIRLFGEGYIGLVKLAHDAGHGPFFTIDFASAGAAKLFAVGVFQGGVVEETVQERGMCWVDAHLEGLEPIAMPQTFECKGVGARCLKTIDGR